MGTQSSTRLILEGKVRLVLPVVVVIREDASSSESTKLVDSKSELIMEDDSYSCPALCLIALCPLRGA